MSDNTLFLTDSDGLIWLRLDGRLLNLDKDLFLCLCYNVPEGSSRLRLIDNVDIFDRISDHMVHIQNITNNKCSFMICGDLNSRTSTFPDYVEDDSSDHISVLPDDYLTDTPLARASKGPNYWIFANTLDCV